jgi:hypothetical protein
MAVALWYNQIQSAKNQSPTLSSTWTMTIWSLQVRTTLPVSLKMSQVMEMMITVASEAAETVKVAAPVGPPDSELVTWTQHLTQPLQLCASLPVWQLQHDQIHRMAMQSKQNGAQDCWSLR